MKKIALILFTVIGVYGKVTAQQPEVILSDKSGWHKIGETTVDFKKETDEVIVLASDRFASLKFKVEDAPINLISCEVYYESGDKQDIKLGFPLKPKGESRVIDLKGGLERNLKKIVFVYKTMPNSKDEKAHVEIWGQKTNANKKRKVRAPF